MHSRIAAAREHIYFTRSVLRFFSPAKMIRAIPAARAFSTTAANAFKKESVTQFSNLIKTKTKAAPKKWQPTAGNSFRSFAEYRLRAVNQSPLQLSSVKRAH